MSLGSRRTARLYETIYEIMLRAIELYPAEVPVVSQGKYGGFILFQFLIGGTYTKIPRRVGPVGSYFGLLTVNVFISPIL